MWEAGQKSFGYKTLMNQLIDQFPTYKNMNLKKRLYDVLNIFIALEYLSKEKTQFLINYESVFSASPVILANQGSPKKYSSKQQKFLVAVAQLKKIKDEVNARLTTLNDMETRLNAYRFFSGLNGRRMARPEKPLADARAAKPRRAEDPLYHFPLSVFECEAEGLRRLDKDSLGLAKGKALQESLLYAGMVPGVSLQDY